MLQTQYNIIAVLPQYNISTVQEINTCASLTRPGLEVVQYNTIQYK